MATSISKAVPRSRLNIKYRTRIDGQVVPKELPLRLLIAGDFSGRGSEPDTVVKGRPLPPLAQRVIYSIGKESTLEGVLGRARVTLPIPEDSTTKREVSLFGHATVRVTRTNTSGKEQYLLSIKSSSIDHAVELVSEAQPANSSTTATATVVTQDSKLFQGEVLALGSFPIVSAEMPKMPESNVDSEKRSEPLKKWHSGLEAFNGSNVWQSLNEVELSGNVAAAVSPAGEPPDVLEVFNTASVYFLFDGELSTLLKGDTRDAIEFRVRLVVPKAKARRAAQVSNMNSFLPGRVAMSVPTIRRLLVIRWLLSQGRSMIGSNPALRGQVKDMLNIEEQRAKEVRDLIASLPPTELATQVQYANSLLDKNITPSEPPEPKYAAPLRVLVENNADKSKEFQTLKDIVTGSWWAAWMVVSKQVAAETVATEKVKLEAKQALLESPWDVLATSVRGLGLEKFVIKGDGQ